MPFVSGTSHQQKRKANTARKAYIQKVSGLPATPINVRKVMLTSRFAPQFAMAAMLAPEPRSRLGNISALISQKTGPMPIANERIYTSKQIKTNQPACCGPIKKMMPIAASVTIMPKTPLSSNGRRPKRSTRNSERIVERTFTTPTMLVARKEAEAEEKPANPKMVGA